jgi:hypothetical protein
MRPLQEDNKGDAVSAWQETQHAMSELCAAETQEQAN